MRISSLQNSNANGDNYITNTSDESGSSNFIDEIDVDNLIENLDEDYAILTNQQYNELLQLKTEKFKTTIKKMKDVIKSKDSKLKELQRNRNWVDLSKLSTVSIFY